MLKFNNNHIFTGYLKQLLASFNLPKYRVYSPEFGRYHDYVLYLREYGLRDALRDYAGSDREGFKKRYQEWLDTVPIESPNIIPTVLRGEDAVDNHVRYVNYIKDGVIQRYIDGKYAYKNNKLIVTDGHWEITPQNYFYGQKIDNQTKTLVIRNNIYDTYTHEYLGDYLRFLRDYNDINLMPLYNCFSNRLCANSVLSFKYKGQKIEFDTEDTNYKIYIVPVKLFNKYTIAIDSDTPIEMCCGFYNKYLDTREKLMILPPLTYKKYNSMKFSQPIVYDKLLADTFVSPLTLDELERLKNEEEEVTLIDIPRYMDLGEIIQNECELKLFIKVPANNNSTITILEGDYSGFNQRVFNKSWKIDTGSPERPLVIDENSAFTVRQNKFITNYETGVVNDFGTNARPDVNSREFIPYTFLQLLSGNTNVSYPFADRLMEYLLGNVITNDEEIPDNIKRVQKVMEINGHEFGTYGLWENKIKNIAYDYMTGPHYDLRNGLQTDYMHDCLGYIDKDVEKFYTGWITSYKLDKEGRKIQAKDKDGHLLWESKPERLAAQMEEPLTYHQLEELNTLGLAVPVQTEVPVWETETTSKTTISRVDIYEEDR